MKMIYLFRFTPRTAASRYTRQGSPSLSFLPDPSYFSPRRSFPLVEASSYTDLHCF